MKPQSLSWRVLLSQSNVVLMYLRGPMGVQESSAVETVGSRVADPYGFSCGSGSGSGSSDPYGFHADPDAVPDPDPT